MFEPTAAVERLRGHLNAPLGSYGLDGHPAACAAAGALIAYLEETQKGALPHLQDIRLLQSESWVLIDATTARNLELTRNLTDGGREQSAGHCRSDRYSNGGPVAPRLGESAVPAAGVLFRGGDGFAGRG